MASQPVRWYYEVPRKYLLNADGGVIQVEDEKPQAALTQRFTANLQLVKDTDLTPYTALDPSVTFQAIVDDKFDTPPPIFELYGDDYGAWKSTTGSEYKYVAETINDKPQLVRIDGSEATEGTVGSLPQGEWGWDGDALYVRLSDDSDPDTKAHGWVEQQPPGTGTQPYMQIFSEDINTAGSWYDEGTESFRDPDPANGEISLVINADRSRFYERLDGASKAETKMAIQVLDGDGELEGVYQFYFICYDRRLPFEVPDLQVDALPYLTPSEIQAEYTKNSDNLSKLSDYIAALSNLYQRVASGAADLSSTDTKGYTILAVTDTTAARSVTISSDNIKSGVPLLVKDESGGAAQNNITVDCEGSETIDGETSVTIDENYGALSLYSDGTNLYINNNTVAIR